MCGFGRVFNGLQNSAARLLAGQLAHGCDLCHGGVVLLIVEVPVQFLDGNRLQGRSLVEFALCRQGSNGFLALADAGVLVLLLADLIFQRCCVFDGRVNRLLAGLVGFFNGFRDQPGGLGLSVVHRLDGGLLGKQSTLRFGEPF